MKQLDSAEYPFSPFYRSVFLILMPGFQLVGHLSLSFLLKVSIPFDIRSYARRTLFAKTMNEDFNAFNGL